MNSNKWKGYLRDFRKLLVDAFTNRVEVQDLYIRFAEFVGLIETLPSPRGEEWEEHFDSILNWMEARNPKRFVYVFAKLIVTEFRKNHQQFITFFQSLPLPSPPWMNDREWVLVVSIENSMTNLSSESVLQLGGWLYKFDELESTMEWQTIEYANLERDLPVYIHGLFGEANKLREDCVLSRLSIEFIVDTECLPSFRPFSVSVPEGKTRGNVSLGQLMPVTLRCRQVVSDDLAGTRTKVARRLAWWSMRDAINESAIHTREGDGIIDEIVWGSRTDVGCVSLQCTTPDVTTLSRLVEAGVPVCIWGDESERDKRMCLITDRLTDIPHKLFEHRLQTGDNLCALYFELLQRIPHLDTRALASPL